MTREIHELTMTVKLDVDLRTNGDGFAYYRVKENLKKLIMMALGMTDSSMIVGNSQVELKDEAGVEW